MNILVVDDNVTSRKLLQAVLQAERFTTCEAADGREALTVLKTQAVHAIISDILMPGMDGYRLCFEVRRQAEFSEIPFIFYSSTYTSPNDERLGLQLGANRFLRKPAAAQEMLAALRELMKQLPRPRPPRMGLPQELSLMKEYSQQLVAKLEERNAELQTLSRRLLEVQETERRHLARELHDEVGQALSVLKLNLEALESSFIPDTPAPGRLADGMRLVDQLLAQVRSMSLDLRPSMLDDLGLVPALRWYVRQYASRTGVNAVFQSEEDDERRFDPALETACFRVAQEALTNALRHARARTVTVTLGEADGVLRLSVRDDGGGFDLAAARERAQHGGSFGLMGMRERVSLLAGELELDSNPGRGTEVCARFPAGRAAAPGGKVQP